MPPRPRAAPVLIPTLLPVATSTSEVARLPSPVTRPEPLPYDVGAEMVKAEPSCVL